MPAYKLIYFNGRGGGEVSRLVFAAAGVDYEDERLGGETWQAKKTEQPMEQLPVLEVDGRKFCQGHAIARFLAREFGLMGKTNIENLQIEEIYEGIVDLMQGLFKIFQEKDDAKKADLKKTMFEESVPKFMNFFDRRLCENCDGNGFFVGKEVTLADIVVYHWLNMVNGFLSSCGDIYAKHPKLKAHSDRVAAIPKIAEWIKKRPVTDF